MTVQLRAWTPGEIQQLRRLAREGTAKAAALVLGRTEKAVQIKAFNCGISFRKVERAWMKEMQEGL